jgi:hypothetical protein
MLMGTDRGAPLPADPGRNWNGRFRGCRPEERTDARRANSVVQIVLSASTKRPFVSRPRTSARGGWRWKTRGPVKGAPHRTPGMGRLYYFNAMIALRERGFIVG